MKTFTVYIHINLYRSCAKPIIYIEVWDKIGDYNKLVEWSKQNNYNIEKLTKNDYKLISV